MSTDSQINRQWQDDDLQPQQSSENYALSGRIMLASIIILFVVVVFLVLLHLYARWYLLRLRIRNVNRRRRSRSRTRIVFYVDNNRPPASIGALDASVLKSLPVFVYSPEINVNLPECAVCLSEFEPGEKGRVLPKCKHSFHTECIDMWFHSNSTCPLCRSPVEAVETEITEPGSSTSQVIETTTSCTDRTKRVDVRIDVPNRTELAAEIGLHLTSPSQGFRSPGSRLLALKRIISMGRKTPAVSPSSGVGPSCGPSVTESDLESGHESSRPGSVGENYGNGYDGGWCWE